MAKSFTETEKENIREKLIAECEKSWAKFGYKRTNLDSLCAKVGISKGAFYLFYNSKEELFCDVVDVIQDRLILIIQETMAGTPTKYDFAKALKLIYWEYDKGNLIFDFDNPDFIAFINKVPKEWLSKHQLNSLSGIHEIIKQSKLTLKVEEKKAMAVFDTLLSINMRKEHLIYDHFEVFNFMLDNMIEEIFE
ncbi:TetR/AcrR family transcriptional regulator [Clostridium frigidicarnis]|uniref:DNA-binding transcriptional regulator, AcrR family n=1 Tax=Clostridium frigidicarnis TaxID=84698 RepID=A0A1I1A6N2_9CLOT|nr:TetR/AcrR family transcriptional regulator [Clostridium frigidicarnis]SFB33577.1 DNA-binding transcriptional regulator, AcrR family [Clostridium frigidicarnis]